MLNKQRLSIKNSEYKKAWPIKLLLRDLTYIIPNSKVPCINP